MTMCTIILAFTKFLELHAVLAKYNLVAGVGEC